MASIIYMATNRENGKRYVGVTSKGLAFRRRQHEQAQNAKRVTCRYFHAAMRKYGPAAFDWAVLAEREAFEDALQAEIRLIADIRPEYNLTLGGQGSKGRAVSQEQRARQSALMRGRKMGPEHSRKTSLGLLGKKHSEQRRARASARRIGMEFTEEHRRNLALAHKGHKQSAETLEKRRLAMAGWRPMPEHVEKVRVALKGKPRPRWIIDKMREGLRLHNEAKKAAVAR